MSGDCDGILFAVDDDEDGDWYSNYYSDKPNTSAMKRLNAVQITEKSIMYFFYWDISDPDLRTAIHATKQTVNR